MFMVVHGTVIKTNLVFKLDQENQFIYIMRISKGITTV